MREGEGVKDIFDEEYFRDGTKSLYVDYKWTPESTAAACHAMCLRLPIDVSESIIDVGCARGFYVRAWRQILHRQAWGVDISPWAIANCDPSAAGYLALSEDGKGIVWPGPFSWAVAKDSLEHCREHGQLPALLRDISEKCEKLFVVVPLAQEDDGRFVAQPEERDQSHQLRKTGGWWKRTIYEYYNDVEMTHFFPGLKFAWQFIDGAHGFVTAKGSRHGP